MKEGIFDSKINSLKEFEKNVSLIFDEIKIKSGLIYKKSSGKLIGFTEMGELNESINEFQRGCDEGKSELDRQFSKYVNMFMVRGIFSNLCYPFGYHASVGFTADQLFPLVWEATRVLEMIGFMVRVWVCDGASPNRKLFSINVVEDGADNWTWNIFAEDNRKIFFMSDVPPLDENNKE